MNKDQITGKWHELKGRFKQKWGKLTDDDIERLGGHYEELAGKIQKSYGITREDAEKQIREFEQSLH